MGAGGWIESLKPRNTGSKVFAALLGLGVLGAGVSAVRGTWSWSGFGFLALLAGVYALTLAASSQKLSQTRALTISLVGIWVVLALVLLLGIWTVLSIADEPGVASGAVVGISILMFGSALLGLVLAVPYSRKLHRLRRAARQYEAKRDI